MAAANVGLGIWVSSRRKVAIPMNSPSHIESQTLSAPQNGFAIGHAPMLP
jgi:hypothetical protein